MTIIEQGFCLKSKREFGVESFCYLDCTIIGFLDPCLGAKVVASSSMDYVPEYTSAAFNRFRISNSGLNGATLKVVDLKLAENSAVKALVNLN